MKIMNSKSKASIYWMGLVKEFKKIKVIYLFALICIVHVIIFSYVPMYGVVMAFRRFKIGSSIFSGEWVGLRYFIQFFSQDRAMQIIGNTLRIGFFSLLFEFPAPILLALAFNEIKNTKYKKVVQTITYMPYFISTVIIVGIVRSFFVSTGIFNDILVSFGLNRINIFADPKYFLPMYIGSDIWQGVGFGTIIYLAALAGVDQEMFEAAIIDGANRIQKIIYITIPCILPTIVMLLILSAGSIIGVGFEKVFLMQTPTNLKVTEVIATYVYKIGIQNANYSFATAIGLLNSVASFLVLIIVNSIAKRMSETSLW